MTEAAKSNVGIYTTVAPAIMGHPAVVEPKKFKNAKGQETGEPKYSAIFVFEPDSEDLKGLKGAMAAVAKAKWPGRDLKELKFPLTAGDTLIEKRKKKLATKNKEYTGDADFQKGMVVLKSSSKYRPQLSVVENGKLVEVTDETLAIHKGKFYFGAKCLAQFNFVAYEATKDGDPDGITCYLNMVLSTNKGERIKSGGNAADVFKGFVGNLSAEDPTAGQDAETVDDDISF